MIVATGISVRQRIPCSIVVFEFGCVAVTTVLAQDVLSALAWPAVLGSNVLAAAAMGAYFWRHHPNLRIEP